MKVAPHIRLNAKIQTNILIHLTPCCYEDEFLRNWRTIENSFKKDGNGTYLQKK